LSEQAKVTVLEAEEQVGFHSSGRSATMLHYALGNPLVRALTLASRPFFDSPPEAFGVIGRRTPVLVHARASETSALNALDSAIAPFATLERVGESEMARLCPILKVGDGGAVAGLVDRDGLRLDPHALLQGFTRILRSNGGTIVTDSRVAEILRKGAAWRLQTRRGGDHEAPIIVNAAGAWADEVAALAGVAPLGLEPKRRTIITFDAADGVDPSPWPFTKTVGDELYFAPESGRLLASPMDEVPTPPCDAQPDEYEMALAAQRMEERTTMTVGRIHSRWAGLRTFAPDRMPVAGFADDAEGFFWLAGQGGFGLQTSPMMAQVAKSLIHGSSWPIESVSPAELSPGRFAG
jgi:D-arginine dehydrogenase